MGKIKKLHQGALVGEGSLEEVYPVTAAQAVYHSNGSNLETLIDNATSDANWAAAANSYYRNSQAGSTAAKVITTYKNMSLIGGGSLKVTFEQVNTADNATLNIDGTGAKPLYYNGKRVSSTNSWEAGETVEIYYNNYNSGAYYAKRWMVEPVSVSQNTLSIGGNYAGEMSTTYDVTLHSGQTFASLSALFSDANLDTLIPTAVRKGGMSIKFVQTSDNKYVQFRYMGTDVTGNPNPFLDTANWQGVDDEPTDGSDNLVKSGGVSAVNLRNKLFTDGFENQVSASQGSDYNNTIDVNIEQNTEFVLNISGADNIISSNYINCKLKRSDDTVETLQYVFPISVELTKNYNIKSITINRSSTGVIGDGIITLSVKAKNPFVKKDELDGCVDEINEHVHNLDVQINGGDVNLLQGLTKLSGYYYSSSSNHIISTADGSSEYYDAIDISQYIGKTLILTNNANKESIRTIALTDSSDEIISTYSYQETAFKNAGGEISVNLDRDNIKYLYVSFSTGAIVTATVLSGIGGDFYKKEQVDGKIQEIDNHLVYVSTSGNDSNDGTSASPVATIQKALTLSSNVKVLNGTYNQDTIDLSLQTHKKINIFSEKDSRVILFGGKKILESDGDIDSTYNNVKYAAVQNFSNSYHWIYQYGVVDASTAININELTPYHKRRTYRCEHTTLVNVDSIQAVNESVVPAFYYDNGILYYSSDIIINSSNFLFVPNGSLFSNTEDVEIHLVGIDVVGKSINFQGTINSSVSDCSAGYSLGDGAFILDNSKNVTLLRCEALKNENGKNNTIGDGINVHSSSVTQPNILNVFTTFSIIDCWSHDNFNDGYSDHEGCQGTIRGGLYEYNCLGGHGAGLTPALGACDVICDVICQGNKYDGIQYHGAGLNQSGSTNGYLYVNSAICRNNIHDGFAFTQSVESGDFVNCLSYNNGGFGFQNYSSNNMRLSNCKASNNTTKDISDGCVIMI